MHRILEDERIAAYERELGRDRIKRVAEVVLGRARLSGDGENYSAIVDAVATGLDRLCLASLRSVVNATGILLHTNLGRAPMSAEALTAVAAVGRSYSNLEYDLETGERGSRGAAVVKLLCDITGAQDALVVNNGAAAVLLVLDTLAKGREVVVARSQLVEIGGGFRVPDVLERSGAKLVEAGTTNRVYIEDFERAFSPHTTLLLRTHASNFRIEGFVAEPSGRDVAALGRRAGVPVAEDLGSGALVDLTPFGIAPERTVQAALSEGIDLVTFSGDKLLGGPQAGIVVGKSSLVARLRNNPLMRALRVDKLTLAALGATLQAYRDGTIAKSLPLYRMLSWSLEELRARAARYTAAMADASAVESEAFAGGGTLPQQRIASIAIAIAGRNAPNLAARLRSADPPVVARIEEDRVLLDLRTIRREEDDAVITALIAATGSG